MKKSYRLHFFIISVLLLLALDRFTKTVAQNKLSGKGIFSYFGDTLRLVYVENTGAFLSLGSSLPKAVSFVILSLLPALTLIYLAYFILKKLEFFSRSLFIGLILILAGGLGNIIDRILFDRHVTDFLNLGFGNLRTGIFNVADIYITTGAIICALFYFRIKPNTENI